MIQSSLEPKNLNEELIELQEYMPLDFENDFFIKMFQNMFIVEETNFYNNVSLNIVFFYIYIVHCFLARLYLADGKHIELLKYIQITEKALSKRDGKDSIYLKKFEKDNEINLHLFNAKEQEAINYFFHILNMDSGCVQCKKNQEIFDIRNNLAHLNFFVADKKVFTELLDNIVSNLAFISEKLYQQTKNLIIKELESSIDEERIDEFNYTEVFEDLNKKYYLSVKDYKLIVDAKYLENIKPYTPKYFINKYIIDDLGLGE